MVERNKPYPDIYNKAIAELQTTRNIVIEDISNTTITELQTEVKVTDILNVTNEGTGPALTVNQIDSTNQDIVQFPKNEQLAPPCTRISLYRAPLKLKCSTSHFEHCAGA